MEKGPKLPLYQVLARKLAWEPKQDFKGQKAEELLVLQKMLPSGSGWDDGTYIDTDRCNEIRIVLYGAWHHMNGHGFYNGWSEHQIFVVADMANGFRLKIKGKDRNQIKEYLHELFDGALRELVDEWPLTEERYAEMRKERGCDW